MRSLAFLVAVVPLLFACVVDNGLLVRNGTELFQDELPVTVEAIESEDLDTGLVEEAVLWWNDQLGIEAFVMGATAEVTVAVGGIPCLDIDDVEACPAGMADVWFRDDGAIYQCDITLSFDIAYHRPTLLRVLEHELGHCLGLDDDPGSLDLGSIMSDPVREGAQVTEHDKDLIR